MGQVKKKWEAEEQLGMQGTPAQAATKGRGSGERGRREDAEGPARRTNATWMTWWVGRFRLSPSPPHLPRRPQKQNPRQRFTRKEEILQRPRPQGAGQKSQRSGTREKNKAKRDAALRS